MILEGFGSLLGTLGHSWALFEGSWALFGRPLSSPWASLGRLWALLCGSCLHLESIWAHVIELFVDFGPMLLEFWSFSEPFGT